MVFAIWLPVLIGVSVISGAIGTNFHTSFDLPDSESKEVLDALEASGNTRTQATSPRSCSPLRRAPTTPQSSQAMTALFDKVDAIEGVKVTSPYSPEGAQFNSDDRADLVRPDLVHERDQAGYIDLADEIQALDDDIQVEGLTIEYGGYLFGVFEFPDSELLGILAAVIILLIAFGSVLAMGLPIGTALFGLGVGFGVVGLGSQCVQHARVLAADDGDDRPGRRHRLRAVHRHPVSREPARAAWNPRTPPSRRSTRPAAPCCSPASPS